ncbi:MAG TPA: hypothetical protein VGJ73_03955 [Verrucomicrobiae bacterium]|jgi:hypothetical protein
MELGLQGWNVGASRSGVCAAAGFFFFLVFSSYSQNLIQNGDFSAGGGSFENWNISHSASEPSYSGPAISGPGYNNPYYARFLNETAGNDILSQDIATTPGDMYDISFWAEDGDGHNLDAEFNFGNFSYNLLQAFAIGPGEWYSGWTNFTFDVTATELETDLSFVIAADTGSEFGVDDVSVVPIVPDFEGVAVGTNFQVTVSTPASYSTMIQASTNMINWVTVCTNTPPFTYTDCMSQFPRRFYRAALVLPKSE